MSQLHDWLGVFLATIRDVLPIVGILFGFQVLVLRQPLPNLRRALTGFFYVFLGMALFLEGLEQALFPLGKLMAHQLTAPEFIFEGELARAANPAWTRYFWVYCFAALIGFSTTIAEPSLIAVAMKAEEVSGGAVSVWGLRVAVALGVAFGIARDNRGEL